MTSRCHGLSLSLLLLGVLTGLAGCAGASSGLDEGPQLPRPANWCVGVGDWGEVTNGLQCRIVKAFCRLAPGETPDEGDRAVVVDIAVELRNVSDTPVRMHLGHDGPLNPEDASEIPIGYIEGMSTANAVFEHRGVRKPLWWEEAQVSMQDARADRILALPPGKVVPLRLEQRLSDLIWPGRSVVLGVDVRSKWPGPFWNGRLASGRFCFANDIPTGELFFWHVSRQ